MTPHLEVAQTNIALYRQLMSAGWSDAELARVAAGYDLAILLFGAQFRGNGKPFICHAVGTASILAAHRADPDVVIAGLLHAAYTHGDFREIDSALLPDRRRPILAAVGAEIEALVAGYATMRWPGGLAWAEPRLALMRLANEVEDHLGGALGFSGKPALRSDDATTAALVALAEQMGHPTLGEQLKQAVTDKPRVPAALRRSTNGSFTPGKPARLLNRLIHRFRNLFLRANA